MPAVLQVHIMLRGLSYIRMALITSGLCRRCLLYFKSKADFEALLTKVPQCPHGKHGLPSNTTALITSGCG